MFSKVRTRFAPSPTGYLHIGGLRTALYSYLYAKQNKGDFLLRIEDTDRQRLVEGATESLVNVLNTVGLNADEGVVSDGQDGIKQIGEHGPYIQSQRLEKYKQAADELINNGYAYYCFCTSERLEEMRTQQQAQNLPPMYDGLCRHLKPEVVKAKLAAGEKYVIRLAVPKDEKIIVNDMVRGEVIFDSNTVDDQVLMKSDGFPTYHLAVVVDDHDMEISHVIRGEEWLSSTPKHVLLYKMFGWEAPNFAHLPLILNVDKSKLSKRQNDVAVEDYLKKGYPIGALINFVALLGWHPSNSEQEIFSLTELIKEFDPAKIQKAGAVFDQEKLNWLCGKYFVNEDESKMLDWLKKSNKDVDDNLAKRYIETCKYRFSIYEDVVTIFEQLKHVLPPIEDLIYKKSTKESAKKGLSSTIEMLTGLGTEIWSNKDLLQVELKKVVSETLTVGDVFWTVRTALSGQKMSPPPEELLYILGKEESLNRLSQALKLFDA